MPGVLTLPAPASPTAQSSEQASVEDARRAEGRLTEVEERAEGDVDWAVRGRHDQTSRPCAPHAAAAAPRAHHRHTATT